MMALAFLKSTYYIEERKETTTLLRDVVGGKSLKLSALYYSSSDLA